ncbi:NADH-quinone oxidoreductase subunit N [Coraliomargarita sinensis]|uniref:NADH-quinone oxidoreductase subunit N n=1 Tax=Coraliomargarita sinensis TaxID=2174842 RepID=A0A317ZJ89_9BACT|nr:NADH-quinone oxidoreductase subunit M [Coraliomargarita sinensis]PXA03401.1 NADH-quinone oxidoreductase subunit N [Coraliomargarita sinensis]
MNDTNSYFLLAAILAPILAGVILLFGARFDATTRRAVAAFGFGWPLIIGLMLYCLFEPTLVGGYNFELRLPTGLESIGIYLHLGLNGISMPLFILAGTVGFAAGLYAMYSNAERPHIYLALLLFMLGGLMGTFASVDVFFFYFFHEFALIPTFIMIGIWGGAGRRGAAIEMTIYLTVGALLSLLGLIALYVESGADSFSLLELRNYLTSQPLGDTIQNNIYALLLFGFGILVSLFPFHSWAPKGYAVAPTGAAMLHAGVLKKFGLYGLLQIAGPLLPAGAAHWFPWIVWLALGNIIFIGLVTLAQKDLKMMLGYSSVMHMGYAFLGLACFSVAGAGGALLMMVAHGFSVALLFMLSTCIYHRSQTFDMSSMGGLATKAPVLAGFFVAGSMASIGLPGFGNFWGEFTIFAALAESDLTRWIVAPAAIGIIISAIYGLRAVANIFFGQPSDRFAERLGNDSIEDLKGYEKLPASILIAGLVLTGIFPRFFSDDADRELTTLYSQEESHLPVHAQAEQPKVTIHEEESR